MFEDVIRRKLLVKYPLFGSIIANIKFIPDETMDCAGTDGKNIVYNPDYISQYSEDQQLFIMAHEVCHIAFNHIFRSEGKHHELWNTATDGVINQLLIKDGLEPIEGIVDIPEAIDYDAEELYEILLKQQEEQQKKQQEQEGQSQEGSSENQDEQDNNGSSSNDDENNEKKSDDNKSGNNGSNKDDSSEESEDEKSNDGNSSDNKSDEEKSDDESDKDKDDSDGKDGESEEKNDKVGHDSHSLWKKAIAAKKAEEKEDGEEAKSFEEQEIDKISEQGEKEAFVKNNEEKVKELKKLRNALACASIGIPLGGNSPELEIKNIGESKPLIDWRYLLKEAINYDIDWSYQDATIEDGVLTPHLQEQRKALTEIVLDTSGSISEDLLKNFLRECKNIIRDSVVKVGCFDEKFYGFQDVKRVEDIDNLKFTGGGGTDFDVAVNAFTDRVDNRIIFTDGRARMPIKPVDAIWVVFGHRQINPPGGKVIYIDQNELNDLYSNKGKRF